MFSKDLIAEFLSINLRSGSNRIFILNSLRSVIFQFKFLKILRNSRSQKSNYRSSRQILTYPFLWSHLHSASRVIHTFRLLCSAWWALVAFHPAFLIPKRSRKYHWQITKRREIWNVWENIDKLIRLYINYCTFIWQIWHFRVQNYAFSGTIGRECRIQK